MNSECHFCATQRPSAAPDKVEYLNTDLATEVIAYFTHEPFPSVVHPHIQN